MHHQQAWAVVLAGGDGTRLQSLTRLIAGEDRPKQFCRLWGGDTLLAATRERLAHVISPERTVFTVVQAHERYYSEELDAVPPSRRIVQPFNQGTTAAVVRSILRVTDLAGDPIVGFFPTDHHYSRELRFAASIRGALRVAGEHPDMVILLGVRATYPEAQYGWIEPGPHLSRCGKPLFRLARFWEKPAAPVAQRLLSRGCLWNTFVMIGRASAFMAMLWAAVPKLLRALGGQSEPPGIEQGDFSRQVLSVSTDRLAVLRLRDVGWTDLGTPERVVATARGLGLRPDWLTSPGTLQSVR